MNEKVTVSFVMDRDIYNKYKSAVVLQGENVKGDLVRHMKQVLAEYEEKIEKNKK